MIHQESCGDASCQQNFNNIKDKKKITIHGENQVWYEFLDVLSTLIHIPSKRLVQQSHIETERVTINTIVETNINVHSTDNYWTLSLVVTAAP
jgi:hypothetical protein